MNFDKSLQDIIFKMLTDNRYVFYGIFLSEINKGFDKDFPTACVGKHPSSPNISLVIGEKFWEKTLYNDSRKIAILQHELLHIMNDHLSDVSGNMFPDKMMANIAMDIKINQDILEEPASPGKCGVELPRLDENGKKCGVYIEDFPGLKLKTRESSLYYYNAMQKAKKDKQGSADKGEDSKGDGQNKGNGKGTSGDGNMDTMLENIEKGEVGDWHSLWDELTKNMGQKERDLLKKEIQESVKRIAKEVEKSRGHIPLHISNMIKDEFGNKEPIISWKTLFNRFIGSALTTDIYQTRKRPNFRFEDAPTNKYKSKIRIVVGCDSSGSVGDDEIKDFFSQIKHMWKAGVKIDVCFWDTNVHLEYEYKGENKWTRVCQGGTHASSFTEYVNDNLNKKHWTCAIGMTDGYVEDKVTDAKIPMLWVITPSGSTSFKNKAKKIIMN